jgi:hypothetical protein
MKNINQIREILEEENEIAQAVYPFLERLILKVYYMGYNDGVDNYQKAIDLKGLREVWDNNNV